MATLALTLLTHRPETDRRLRRPRGLAALLREWVALAAARIGLRPPAPRALNVEGARPGR